jgi:hypothetical protein|eukprot:COSAG01_NODE_2961_length_6792_cov_3.056178_2_plen_89_part_00
MRELTRVATQLVGILLICDAVFHIFVKISHPELDTSMVTQLENAANTRSGQPVRDITAGGAHIGPVSASPPAYMAPPRPAPPIPPTSI